MALPKDYLDELNTLNKEVQAKQPKDVLQFCANYFQGRLDQRKSGGAASQQALRESSQSDSIDPSHAVPTAGHTSTFKSVFSKGPMEKPGDAATPPAAGNLFSASFGGSSRSAAAATGGRLGGHFPTNFNANRRTSVSAESLNPSAFSGAAAEPASTRVLTPGQFDKLKASIGKNFLFSNLDEEALKSVLSALQEKKVPAGSTIITQGEEGDFFYIVESGLVEFSVNGQVVGDPAGAGSSFGELALMYNSPRAATVKATKDTALWALDRLTFRRILMDKTASIRKLYGEVLKEVPILSVLNSYELNKLADAMSSESFNPGAVVIREGDKGEQFYIIESGEAEITRDGEGKVQDLGKGGYFGEVALLNDLPRQATVTAKTKLRVVTLDKSGFQRLLGPVVDILKRQDPTQK